MRWLISKSCARLASTWMPLAVGWDPMAGRTPPTTSPRGLFAGEVGTPRLLKLFDRLDIKTSWFIPGHSIETFPEECRMIVEQGA